MEILNNWISGINDLLWSYVLIIMLLGCAFRFTFKTRFVQFRMFREMIRVLGDSANKAHEGEKHISSFQAFAVSLASRVGTGNLAGVATAIAVGGPGAVFWMWTIALLGSASAFVESTLAQLYKRKGKESFIGGPAYYMRYGLGLNWMGILFAILISVTFGFAFNSVQSNTICAAMQGSFGFDPRIVGAVLTVLTLTIIFGGIQRIAKVSSVIVPVMALGYVALASGIVLFNITELPAVIKLIVSSAFGWEQAAGGTISAALMQGIKRGLFSNEAGMGSAPNVAATASVTHPVKQGLIQTLGVFTDTLLICTCTAFYHPVQRGAVGRFSKRGTTDTACPDARSGKSRRDIRCRSDLPVRFQQHYRELLLRGSEHSFHHTEKKRALYLPSGGRRYGDVRGASKSGTRLEPGGYHDGFHDDLQPVRHLVAEQTGLPAAARLHCSKT